jgi:hypothetical protein
MADSSLARLRAKRRRIHAQLRKLKPLLAGYHEAGGGERGDPGNRPALWMPPRTYQRNAMFARNASAFGAA